MTSVLVFGAFFGVMVAMAGLLTLVWLPRLGLAGRMSPSGREASAAVPARAA